MPAVIEFSRADAIPESTTGTLGAQLDGDNGGDLVSSAVTALVATLTNHQGTIVNGRSAATPLTHTILNANGGTLSSTGFLTQVFSPADTVAVETGPEYQQRFFTISGTHSGTKTLACEIRFWVRKLTGYP
jgi:hypothetical protein